MEFALVAPLFFLLLLAVIEGGRFILYYETLNNATREGARYAIVHGANSYCPSGPMPPARTRPRLLRRRPAPTSSQTVKDSAFGLLGTGVVVTPRGIPTILARCSATAARPRSTSCATLHLPDARPVRALPPITVSAESTLVINN